MKIILVYILYFHGNVIYITSPYISSVQWGVKCMVLRLDPSCGATQSDPLGYGWATRSWVSWPGGVACHRIQSTQVPVDTAAGGSRLSEA